MNENENLTAMSAPTIVLTQPGEGGEPEPRRVFRKLSNSTALAVFFDICLTAIVSYIILYLPIFVMMIKQGISDFNQAAQQFSSSAEYYFWVLLASALAALIGNTVPGIVHGRRQGYRPLECFKKGEAVPGLFGKCLIVAFGLNTVWAYLYYFLTVLLPQEGIDNSQFSLEMPEAPESFAVYVFFVCVIAPVTEEFLFRGIILRSLSKYGPLFAAVASSLMFGLLHGNLQQTPMAFLVGMVFAYAAIRTGSIKMSILLHFCMNTVSTAVSYLVVSENTVVVNTASAVYGIVSLASIVGTLVILTSNARRIHWLPQFPLLSHTVLTPAKTKTRAKLLAYLMSFWVLMFIIYSVDCINYSLGNRAILECLGMLFYELKALL